MSKSIVIVPLARFQPPHKEHKNLVDSVLKLATKTHSDAKIYVSRSVDKKKNPFTPQEKIRFLNKMFPGHKGLFDMPPASLPNMVGVLKSLEHYDTVHIVLGDERVEQIQKLVDGGNGKDFHIKNVTVQSRHSITNTRSGDADGIHASEIREWAREGNFAKVRAEMPDGLSDKDVKEIIRIIQSRLGKTMTESVIIEEEIPLPSDAEIDRYLDKLTDMSDLDLRDEDAMMLDMIVSDEEPKNIHEGLTSQQRQKRSQKMKSMSKRLARLRKIKSKQMPAGQRLRLRARKAAIMILRARASGRKNLDYNALSRSQRISVDNALTQRFGKSLKGAINRIATRILPRIRSKAQASVAQARSSTNEAFHMFLEGKEGSEKDTKSDIKQAKAKHISVSDWEKSKADTQHDSPLHIDTTKIDSTKVDPTTVDRAAPNPTHATSGAKRLSQFRLRTEARSSAADAVDAGDTNIIYQMRKVIIARGEHEVVFGDKHKAKISVADARKMLDLFDKTRLPADKQKLTVAAGKSLAAFKSVLSHGIPKDKPKISLGGKQMHEASWNAIKWNPNNPDAPPGMTQANEKKKLAKEYAPRYNPNDPDTPLNYSQTFEKKKSAVKEDSEDPNQSRRLNQKMDVLLRLGLVDTGELQNYRSALRSSQKYALQSPGLRKNLADLLDKLIDLTTQDPATYSRVRYNVVNKELDSKPNPDLRKKAKKSGVDEDVLNQVFAREIAESNNVNRAYGRVNSFIAGGFAAKLDEDLVEDGKGYKNPTGGLTQKGRDHYNRKTGGNLKAPVTTEPSKLKAGSKSANRRKSFCARMGGMKKRLTFAKTARDPDSRINKALRKWNCRSEETATEAANFSQQAAIAIAMKKDGKKPKNESPDPCWTGYHQVGMKNKGGKPVPNCVPEQSTHDAVPLSQRVKRVKQFHAKHPEPTKNEDVMARHADHKVVRVKKGGNFTYRKVYEAPFEPAREPTSAFVVPNHKHPTGKTAYGSMSNNELRKKLSKTVATSSSESYVGTDEIRKNYASATPGQQDISIAKYSVAKPVVGDAADGPDKVTKTPAHFKDVRKALAGIRESRDLNEAFSAGFELAPFARDYGITVKTAFEHHPYVQEELDKIETTYKSKSQTKEK